ncbi:unnamed protein product [Rhizopus stolonifer]
MWSLLKSNDNNLSIQLLEPVIFVGSHINTSPVLRGIINISSYKKCSMKQLAIHFQGVAKIRFVLNNKLTSDERLITRKDLTLYSSLHDEIDKPLNSDSNALFSFELPLPTGLPETIQSPQIQVSYQFTLSMDYIKNKKKLSQRANKSVIVVRLPHSGLLAGENLPEMIGSRKHISPWCQYRITIQKSVALGSTLPIQFELVPMVKGFKLKHVFVQLLERRTVIPEVDGQERTGQFCYFIHPTKRSSLQLPSNALHDVWETSVEYQIPQKSVTHSTKSYRNFSVEHLLLISFVINVLEEGKRRKRPRIS